MKKRTIRTFSRNRSLVNERRKQIVQGAIQIFYERGYSRCGMREIAAACGVTTGVIYHYVGSKDDILHLIIKHSQEQVIRLRRLYRKLTNCDIASVLEKCILEYFQIVNEDRRIIMVYNRDINYFSETDRDYLLNSYVKSVEFFNELLIKGLKFGQFEFSCSPMLLAHNIITMAQEIVLRWWFLKNHFTFEEYTKQQVAIILKIVVNSSNK